MSVKNKLAAVVCGLALAGTVAMPVAALADQETVSNITSPNTGTTEVTIQAAKSSDGKDQLSFSVPTVIPFAVTAKDGTLVGPDASATQIVNKSVFPIHVTKMAVAEQSPFHVVSDTSHSTTENDIQFTIHGAKAAADVDLSKDVSWDMEYAASSDKNHINLDTTNGKVARVTADLSKAQKVATITWTLAAGKAE